MELSSPVASLVPSLVLNAVVTFGSLLFGLAAIPFRRVPVLRDPGRRLLAGGEDSGEEAQERPEDKAGRAASNAA
jgi:hypothetical protein